MVDRRMWAVSLWICKAICSLRPNYYASIPEWAAEQMWPHNRSYAYYIIRISVYLCAPFLGAAFISAQDLRPHFCVALKPRCRQLVFWNGNNLVSNIDHFTTELILFPVSIFENFHFMELHLFVLLYGTAANAMLNIKLFCFYGKW